MKTLLLTMAVLTLFLCSGCTQGEKATSPVIRVVRTILGETADVFTKLFDLLGFDGSDVKSVPQNFCNTLQRPDVQTALAVVDRLPISFAAQRLNLNPSQTATLSSVAAVGPVLVIRWGTVGMTLLCQAFFPNERPAGTAVVVICDREGCGPLQKS